MPPAPEPLSRRLGRPALFPRPPPLHDVIEVARVAAVRSYHLLGMPADPVLEGFAHQAAACFGVGMGAVVLADADRVGPVAGSGWPTAAGARAGSFCDRVLGQVPPLLVPDAPADADFAQHPSVQGPPFLRFYAGAALVDSDLYRLGAICVCSPEPHIPAPDQVDRLAALAAEVVAAMEARRAALAAVAAAPLVQGWLGVRTARANRFDRRPGLLILSVAAGSPAARTGLRATDIILSIDGAALRRPRDVIAALASRPAGSDAQLRLLRTGMLLDVILTVESEPAGRVGRRSGPGGW